jgi:hypothetical protein
MMMRHRRKKASSGDVWDTSASVAAFKLALKSLVRILGVTIQ